MKLKERRVDAGLTQDELARKSRVSRSTIINYEQGHRTPRITELKRICDALGCAVSEVLGDY